MAYGAALERRFGGNLIVGSNPTSSAIYLHFCALTDYNNPQSMLWEKLEVSSMAFLVRFKA